MCTRRRRRRRRRRRQRMNNHLHDRPQDGRRWLLIRWGGRSSSRIRCRETEASRMEGRPRVPPHVDSMQRMSGQGGGGPAGWAPGGGEGVGGGRPGGGQALGGGDQGGGKHWRVA